MIKKRKLSIFDSFFFHFLCFFFCISVICCCSILNLCLKMANFIIEPFYCSIFLIEYNFLFQYSTFFLSLCNFDASLFIRPFVRWFFFLLCLWISMCESSIRSQINVSLLWIKFRLFIWLENEIYILNFVIFLKFLKYFRVKLVLKNLKYM